MGVLRHSARFARGTDECVRRHVISACVLASDAGRKSLHGSARFARGTAEAAVAHVIFPR